MAEKIQFVNPEGEKKHVDKKKLLYPYYQEVIIDKFVQKMTEIGIREKYGQEYDNSLIQFASGAKAKFNRGFGKHSHFEVLRNLAYNHFGHRHNLLRGALDILMYLTGVGLTVGIVRACCMHTTFHFSTAKTNRQEQFEKHLESPHDAQSEDIPLLFPGR